MAYPHTLIFVDLPSDDPAAAGKFYSEVFGWRDDDRPAGLYHRMVPGGNFLKSDGGESEIGNLHLGIFKDANARPHPDPAGVEPRELSQSGRKPRIWILVSGRRAGRCDPGARRGAGRDPAVAQSLLVDLQWLQPRLRRPLGQ